MHHFTHNASGANARRCHFERQRCPRSPCAVLENNENFSRSVVPRGGSIECHVILEGGSLFHLFVSMKYFIKMKNILSIVLDLTKQLLSPKNFYSYFP